MGVERICNAPSGSDGAAASISLWLGKEECCTPCRWNAYHHDFFIGIALKNDSTLEKEGCSATYQSEVFLPDVSWDLKAS